MKRSALVIYIVMIIVGVIGLFFFMNQSNQPAPLPVQVTQPEVRQEQITVAIATRDLEANSVLNADDFTFKTISVPEDSADKQFNISGINPANWALRSAISAESQIPPSALVAPGSDDYLTMFLQPGFVLYNFSLNTSDNYLLTNLRPGQEIDIYLSYSIQMGPNGIDEVVSPARSIQGSRLKPLMLKKRVLALRPAKLVQQDGVEVLQKGSQLIAELKDSEIKLLKGLEGKAEIFIFPASQTAVQEVTTTGLSDMESSWPVNNDVIFVEPETKSGVEPVVVTDVRELRG